MYPYKYICIYIFLNFAIFRWIMDYIFVCMYIYLLRDICDCPSLCTVLYDLHLLYVYYNYSIPVVLSALCLRHQSARCPGWTWAVKWRWCGQTTLWPSSCHRWTILSEMVSLQLFFVAVRRALLTLWVCSHTAPLQRGVGDRGDGLRLCGGDQQRPVHRGVGGREWQLGDGQWLDHRGRQ